MEYECYVYFYVKLILILIPDDGRELNCIAVTVTLITENLFFFTFISCLGTSSY